MRRSLLSLLFAALLGSPHARAEEAPPRVASLNLCADELVLRLADPAQVTSVTWLAHDPRSSNVADLASRTGINHGLAEEIVLEEPDLVIAGAFTTRDTVAFLRRAGTPVLELGVPQTFDETYAQIEKVARVLGHPQRGTEMVVRMRAALDASPPAGAERPRAFVLRPNGFTIGPGSLVDELLTRAGLANAAAELGLEAYGQIPLETVVLNDADILVIDAEEARAPALAAEILRHPVLRRLDGRIEIVALPSRLWTCAGPAMVEAVKRLREGGRQSGDRQAGERPAGDRQGGS